MNWIRKSHSLIFMGAFLLMSLTLFTGCEKDMDPAFSDIKVCVDFPSGESECDANLSTIQTTDPTIRVSVALTDADISDYISFNLYYNNGGDLIEIATFRDRIENLVDDSDGNTLKAFGVFTKPSNVIWTVGEWEIQVELESENPISITKNFTVVE